MFSRKERYETIERSERCFFQLFWLFWFIWLWEFSMQLYPDLWDNPEYTQAWKAVLSTSVFAVHAVSVAVYFWSNPLIYELPSSFKLFDLLTYLADPYVLIILALVFVVSLRLKRYGFAAGLWGFAGYYNLFRLLPEKTGMPARDMKVFFNMLGSTNGLIFIGGNLIIMLGIGYILFHRE